MRYDLMNVEDMLDRCEPVENDCEDQGFTRICDGCFVCFPDFDWGGKPVRPQLVQRERYGRLFWVCPKCGGSYGEVDVRHNAEAEGPERR